MVISVISFSVVMVAGGFVVFRIFAKPPELPDLPVDMSVYMPADTDVAAFFPPDGDAEDMYIGGGLHAPEGFTSKDRKEQFYTFLIVGMDKGTNTDTIMLASYDGINTKANVIGIPRDSKVNVKRSVKKINSAYAAGTLHGGGKDGGIDQLKRELKTIVGFVPDYYVCIDLAAFTKIVDAVGGIEIDVPFDMKYDDVWQDLHIDIKKGVQVLNGSDALKFARYRKGNNRNYTITDYKRIENQQAVITAVLSKLLRPENLLKVPEFIDIFNENVYTDIKLEEMLWFAEQINKVRGTDALNTHTIPTLGSSGLPDYFEFLDKNGIVNLVNETINPYKKNIEAKDLDIAS